MKYLGLDWGLKKIGLAISEGELADPAGGIEIKSLKEGIEKIVKKVRDEGADLVVIGKPEGGFGKKVEDAAKLLRKEGIRVELADETLSTQEAKREMIRMGTGKLARREDHAVAAAIILQRYLDEEKP